MPRANEELAAKVKELVEQVQQQRAISWEHVYGHTGAHDNELAERAANEGSRGKVSDQSQRWVQQQDAITAQSCCQGPDDIDNKSNQKLNFRKVAQEKCRKVPAVDCFYVLKTVPDIECAPESYEDCIDVVKEVILAAQDDYY